MRNYMDENIIPHVFEWEEKKQQPKELFKQVADLGFIAAAMFPLPPKEYMQGVTLPAGIKVQPRLGGAVGNCSMRSGMGFMILCLMMSLVGLVPLAWAWSSLGVTSPPPRCAGVLTVACQIGLPPIIHHGPKWMKKKIIPECLKGEKRICLAITEPSAGSDVAGLTTTAVKTPDGKYYIVNGEKKWVFCPQGLRWGWLM